MEKIKPTKRFRSKYTIRCEECGKRFRSLGFASHRMAHYRATIKKTEV